MSNLHSVTIGSYEVPFLTGEVVPIRVKKVRSYSKKIKVKRQEDGAKPPQLTWKQYAHTQTERIKALNGFIAKAQQRKWWKFWS
jgi:hypothetical protein